MLDCILLHWNSVIAANRRDPHASIYTEDYFRFKKFVTRVLQLIFVTLSIVNMGKLMRNIWTSQWSGKGNTIKTANGHLVTIDRNGASHLNNSISRKIHSRLDKILRSAIRESLSSPHADRGGSLHKLAYYLPYFPSIFPARVTVSCVKADTCPMSVPPLIAPSRVDRGSI